MAKIRYDGSRPYRHRTLGGGRIRIPNNAPIEIKEDEEVERLLALGGDFRFADDEPVSEASHLPQPKVSRRPFRKLREKTKERLKKIEPEIEGPTDGAIAKKATKSDEHGGVPCMRAHPGKSHKDWKISTKNKTDKLREEAKKKLKEL